MKLETFEYLLAIEKYGSLNKAAKQLYVSQPNLSNVLTSFENELGYPVLYRNHQGIQFTEQGKEVLVIARNIIKEKEKLASIGVGHQRLSLHISIGNGDYALKPVFTLLHEQEQNEIDLLITNCAVYEALEKVYDQELDVAYFIISDDMKKQCLDYARIHHLIMSCLKETVCEISIRAGHPILENFTKEQLWHYPFVDFTNQRPNAYGIYGQYINPHKMIAVDHHSLRNQIVRETNAYSIGIKTSKRDKQLIGIPTPELKMSIYEIRRDSDRNNPLLNRYKQLIEKELIVF